MTFIKKLFSKLFRRKVDVEKLSPRDRWRYEHGGID